MTPERRAALAKGLKENPLLAVLIDERRAELREAWEDEQSAETREALWRELDTLNNLRDFLDARIDAETRAA